MSHGTIECIISLHRMCCIGVYVIDEASRFMQNGPLGAARLRTLSASLTNISSCIFRRPSSAHYG